MAQIEVTTAIIDYGYTKLEFNAMPGGFGIKTMIEDIGRAAGTLATILKGKTIKIGNSLRNIEPNYESYDSIAKEYKVDVNTVAAKFWNRTPKPPLTYGMVNVQEWIYRDFIMTANGNPLSDRKHFVPYSAHFPYGGDKPYSCAVDFNIPGISLADNEIVLAYINKEYPNMFAEYHKVGKGAWHFHVEDRKVYSQVSKQLQAKVNSICGYEPVAKFYNPSPSNPAQPLLFTAINPSKAELTWDAKLELRAANPDVMDKESALTNEVPDKRTMLPEDIGEDGLMEVLRIGDINFSICPVTQISYSQSTQFVRFSTLRTVGDPKIASETIPNNITLNIIFPNAEAINNQLSRLVAQFMVTPITVVQSRFIARTLKPVTVNHRNAIQGTFDPNKTSVPQDESMWMIMTDINIRSVNGFPEAFEAFITFEVFEDRVFGDSLRFIRTDKDLREKYRRKQLIMNNSYIMPSEKSMLQSASSYTQGVIDVTSDPNDSKLYKDFYMSVKKTLRNYDPGEYEKSGGKFRVLYNTQDFSRDSIRSIKKKIEDAYNASLEETQKLINNLTNEQRKYLISKNLDPMNMEDIRGVARGTAEATVSQIQMAVEEGEYTQIIQGYRYGIMDSINKFRSMQYDADIFIKSLGDAPLSLSASEQDQTLRIFKLALGEVGTALKYSDNIFSVGLKDSQGNLLSNQLTNPVPGNEITSTGLINELSVLYGENLFPDNPNNTKVLSEKVNRIYSALKKLTTLCLNNSVEGKLDLDQDGLPNYPNQFKEITLVDGVNSYTSGISFSMSNKVVAQQVIGWRQPTFQHLGRSDWSINMNIVSKGDKAVHDIMYVLQRTGLLSKQVQFTSPAKYINLDTNLYITAGDPIFGALGIEGLALNSVEISSIPGQPNMYQINLGLEQSDLTIRDMESIKEAPFKKQNNEALSSLYSDVLPVLKALVIRPDLSYYGKFLDFQRIKTVVDDPNLLPFWQAYGLAPLDSKEPSMFDYMDKYSFYKAMLGVTDIKNPTKNWDLLMKDIFPKLDELKVKMDNQYKVGGLMNAATTDRTKPNINTESAPASTTDVASKRNLNGTSMSDFIAKTGVKKDGAPGLEAAVNALEALVKTEASGNLTYGKGIIKTPDNLAISLEPYFESIGHLVNSNLNNIYNNIAKMQGLGGSTLAGSYNTFDLNIGTLTGGGVAALIADVVLLSSNPIGWGVLIAFTIGAAITAGVMLLSNKADRGLQVVRDTLTSVLPSIFNTVVNGRLVDLAKELIADQSSLNMFAPDFEIGKDKNGHTITLQSKILEIRDAIGALLGSCYNDFSSQILLASARTGLPEAILDPAFYLYSGDFITVDLIREVKTDIQNRISDLVAKANIMALQLGSALEDKYRLPKDYKLDTSLPVIKDQPASSIITEDDIKWCIAVKREIVKINMNAFEDASIENITKMQNLQGKTEDTKKVFFNQYWRGANGAQVAEKTGAFMETAFARLLLINSALRFDVIKMTLEISTAKLSGLSQSIRKVDDAKANDKQPKNVNMQEALKNDQMQQYQQYDIFFNKQDYEPPKTNPESNSDTQKTTWYAAIIEAGSKDSPYKRATSVNAAFQAKYKKNMDQFFTGRMKEILDQTEVIARCKKASTNDISAEMMAIYNGLDADPKMLDKRIDQVKSIQDILFKSSLIDNTGNPIRIFPTYKIYFIEEDAPEWGIYNDFYDYSAVQEITVVKDRESASDTCVIKLSNVAGKLTDSFAENLPEFGTTNLPMTSMMLKPGMSILVKMGYSNNQVELPVVFYGIIVEVQPGPIVEIVCQGYGAELNEQIAPNEGVHHGMFGDVKALGDVATWAIQQATGLNHFGKMGASDMLVSDTLRLSGTSATGLQGRMKIASFIAGLPGLSFNDPRDDNIFLPYNLANITDKVITSKTDAAITYVLSKYESSDNLTFDWYIRDQTIWNVLSELVWFSPDFIKVVLPYNDNVFPFLPKIRNTLYVGPKRGYYKYTDMFSMIALDEGVEFPDGEQVADLLFNIGKSIYKNDSVVGSFWFSVGNAAGAAANANTTGVDNTVDNSIAERAAYINAIPEMKQLKTIFDKNNLIKQACEVFFTTNFTNNLPGQEVTRDMGLALAAETMANKYMTEFTTRSRIHPATIEDVDRLLVKLDRNFTEALKKFTIKDIGMNGVYYNIKGNHHQYKKVQQHHIATSYTNILNNNIIATGDGWANQIKLICPPEPKDYTSIQDVQIEDRKDFITTVFNLDDDILDDQIRPKVVFVNNIDPSLWDDSVWAKKVFKGEGTWTTINGDEYATFDDDRSPTIKTCNGKDQKFEDKQLEITRDDKSDNTAYQRNVWENMPSRWRVGISLLAQEARNMYNGELTLSGNSNIKPYDVIHLIDYVNDMHGSFEVGRVIHTLSPQTGFTTRIKPDLIVAQKNKFTMDEIFIASSMMQQSFTRSFLQFTSEALGAGAGAGVFHGISTGVAGAAGASTAVLGAITTLGLAAAGVGIAYGGYKAVKYHHERIIMTMNNMIGRDSIDILPLTYRNVPYVAGIEGIKKDSYMRHMYGAVTDKTGKYNIFERMGYMNAPLEFEFYKNVAGDSKVWSFIQSNILFSSNQNGVGGLMDQGRIIARGILNPGTKGKDYF